jgi:hypothetical protein
LQQRGRINGTPYPSTVAHVIGIYNACLRSILSHACLTVARSSYSLQLHLKTSTHLVKPAAAAAAAAAAAPQVTSSTEQGMYSPWTLSGSIVVEGFAASTHTAWPYKAQLLQLLPRKHAVAAQHLLAQAHHAVQAPLRAVYRALGKGPLALLDSVVFSVMEAVKAPGGGLAAAVRAAAQATTAA